MSKAEQLIERWVEMWNTYDLLMVRELFLLDGQVTYFSSERKDLISGIDSVLAHHEGFGFVAEGKAHDNRLWLEKTVITELGRTAVVTSIWYFRKGTGELMRGPVTFVCRQTDQGYRFAHLHFATYHELETR